MENERYPFYNEPLPYDYDALEPFLDTLTMHLHHDRHLQTYVDHLNETLADQPALQPLTLPQLIQIAPKLPQPLQNAVRNNAGGVYNHRFFFDLLKRPAREQPQGSLALALDQTFGSFGRFQASFRAAALSVFGSGYAWLVLSGGRLTIITSPNQNNPLELGMCPILTLDVWEHAYYLKHFNQRAAYLDDWFRIINWAQAEQNFLACL